MGKDKKSQDKPAVRSDQKNDDDFNRKIPDPNDPDFQIPAPNMDFPNIGDFQNRHIDDTIIGDIDDDSIPPRERL